LRGSHPLLIGNGWVRGSTALAAASQRANPAFSHYVGNRTQASVFAIRGDCLMDRKRSASEEAVIEHVQKKLGEAFRSQYELARPLPDGLYQLVIELEQRSMERNRRPPKKTRQKP
jgi:hypothetical protein